MKIDTTKISEALADQLAARSSDRLVYDEDMIEWTWHASWKSVHLFSYLICIFYFVFLMNGFGDDSVVIYPITKTLIVIVILGLINESILIIFRSNQSRIDLRQRLIIAPKRGLFGLWPRNKVVPYEAIREIRLSPAGGILITSVWQVVIVTDSNKKIDFAELVISDEIEVNRFAERFAKLSGAERVSFKF